MTLGYCSRLLVVNLTTQTFNFEELEESVYRHYYGGYGLGVYYIYKNIKPHSNPLGSDNILGFLPGLLTGSPAPMTGRYVVCAKSPLTGTGDKVNGEYCTGGWGNANSGGFFGPAIRRAGFDGIFFTGIAKQPVYLFINDDEIALKEAHELWGKDVVEAEELLKAKHGKNCRISAIGPAGEHMSLISGIVTDGGRIAARSGLGAVMGSKNLKAICLLGNHKVEYADRNKVMELAQKYNRTIKRYQNSKIINKIITLTDRLAPLFRIGRLAFGRSKFLTARLGVSCFSEFGTNFINVLSSQNGDSPIKNFTGVGYKDFPMRKAMKLRGKIFKRFVKEKYGCYGCSVRCGAILEYEGLPYKKKQTHRPEYESTASFGSMLLNDNPEAILFINEYLNRNGMDTISAGNVIAFAMECCEQGLLQKGDFKCTDFPEGFLLKWGECEYILPLLKLMVSREGIGNILADGTKRASKTILGSEEFTVNANGQEIPMHDSRLDPALGVTYITDPTPGRHTAGSIDFQFAEGLNFFIKDIFFENSKDPFKKGKHSAKVSKFHQTIETLGFCLFALTFGWYPYLEMLKATFGWIITPEELLTTGHRIQTLRQMFNAREGAIRHELTQRVVGNPPLKNGPLKKVTLDLETMAQGYYEGMGFKENGVPSEETLRLLNLDFCIPDLEKSLGVPKALVNDYLLEKKSKPYHWRLK